MDLTLGLENDLKTYDWQRVPSDFNYNGACFSLDLRPYLTKAFLDATLSIWIGFSGKSKKIQKTLFRFKANFHNLDLKLEEDSVIGVNLHEKEKFSLYSSAMMLREDYLEKMIQIPFGTMRSYDIIPQVRKLVIGP